MSFQLWWFPDLDVSLQTMTEVKPTPNIYKRIGKQCRHY